MEFYGNRVSKTLRNLDQRLYCTKRLVLMFFTTFAIKLFYLKWNGNLKFFWDNSTALKSQSVTSRSQNEHEISERYPEISDASLRPQSVTLRSMKIPWDLRTIAVISEQYPEISERTWDLRTVSWDIKTTPRYQSVTLRYFWENIKLLLIQGHLFSTLVVKNATHSSCGLVG